MCQINVLYKHWGECNYPYGISWIIALRSSGIICIRLIRPRPMQCSKRGTIDKGIIKFYLDQDTNVDKRKIIQCSSRAEAYPAIPFHQSRYSRLPCHR